MCRDSSFLYRARYEKSALPHFADHEPETVLCLCLLARVPRKADAPCPIEPQEVVAGVAVGYANSPAAECRAARRICRSAIAESDAVVPC